MTAHPLLQFRPLAHSDYSLLQRWLSKPHVLEWWNEALDLAGIAAKYGPRIEGSEPTHVYIMNCDNHPFGWIQWYRWADYPKHAANLDAESSSAGIDLAIGERPYLGRGLGSRAIRDFVRDYVFRDRSISACISDPDALNARSIRAFERVGFRVVRTILDNQVKRCVVRLDAI